MTRIHTPATHEAEGETAEVFARIKRQQVGCRIPSLRSARTALRL